MKVVQMAKPQKADSNILTVPFCQIHPVGLSLPDNLDAEQWMEVGRALGRVKGVLMWAVGDWWAFGEHRYGERAACVARPMIVERQTSLFDTAEFDYGRSFA